MSVILMTTLFYKALILQGEIWCWSLLGLKGIKHKSPPALKAEYVLTAVALNRQKSRKYVNNRILNFSYNQRTVVIYH